MRNLGLAIIGLCLLSVGCAGTSATPLGAAARVDTATFYVENHGTDQRNIESVIAGALEARGVRATGGHRGQAPENVDFIVSYEDRWGWDMRTYLRLIRIDVRDAKSGAIVGSSESHQDSLTAMGKSWEEIVESTTAQLFSGTP